MHVVNRRLLINFYSFIAGLMVLVLARLVCLPLSETLVLDFTWIAALVLASMFKNRFLLSGIFVGYLLGSYLFCHKTALPLDSNRTFILNLLTGLCICVSAYLVQKKQFIQSRFYWVGMIIILLILGGWILNQETLKTAILFYAASVITGCLSCLKNTSLNHCPSILVMAWLVGYAPLVILIFLFELDPSGTYSGSNFTYRHLFIPFPIYLLEILIGCHIIQALQTHNKDEANS